MTKNRWETEVTPEEVREFYVQHRKKRLIPKYIAAMHDLIEQYKAGERYSECPFCWTGECALCPWIVLMKESCMEGWFMKNKIIRSGKTAERIESLKQWIKIYKKADVLKGRKRRAPGGFD